jgi:hypothetical protein
MQMKEKVNNTDETENRGEDTNNRDPYSDAHGEPLTCPRCGEYVAVHYHPQGKYYTNYAGFVAHCACSAGPRLELEAIKGLDPAWFADIVKETEADPESWIEFYLHEGRDVSNWVEGNEGE